MSNEENLNHIIEQITSSQSKSLHIVFGDYRQGKTYFLNLISNRNSKYSKRTFKIEGISNLFNVSDYSIFINFISQNEQVFKETILNITRNIIETNKYTKTIMQIMKDTTCYPIDFNSNEILLLQRMKTFMPSKKSYLLCDDFDQWDEASQIFLLKLFQHNIFNNTKYVITCNSSFKFSKDILSKMKFEQYTLENMTFDETRNYLHRYNVYSQEKEIYESTNGNIGQLNDLLKFLHEDNSINNFNQVVQNINNVFIEKMPIKNITKASIEMVNKSSILGMQFKNKILEHFSELKETYDDHLLNVKSAGVLRDSPNSQLEFTDEFVWKILAKFNKENKKYHLCLAKTIRIIMPSNFLLAANEYFYAGNESDAAKMFFLALMQKLIRFRNLEVLDISISQLLEKYKYKEYINKFIDVYSFYFNGQFNEAFTSLPIYSNDLAINYEIDFIKILILINSNVLKSNYKEAYNLCSVWISNDEFENKEPYLWLKMAILCLEISCELSYDTDVLFKKITFIFSKYIENDDNMALEFYCFKIQNNYKYSIDMQYAETKTAVTYFEKNHLLSSWNLLICAYINHSANALVLGKYEESIVLNQKALKILSENIILKEYLPPLVNNDIVTKFLYKKDDYNLTDFISIMEELVSQTEKDLITQILIKINLGLLYFYNFSYEKSLNLYTELYLNYANLETVDDYYRYFIINNFNFLNLFINNAVYDLSFSEKLSELSPLSSNKEFFNSRNRLIQGYILKFQESNQIRDFLDERSILGKAWSFWGRTLLFTDIQYWTY